MKKQTAPKGTKKPTRGKPAQLKDPVIVDGIGTMEREQAERLYPNVKHRSTTLYKEECENDESFTLVEVSHQMVANAARKALSKAKACHDKGDEVTAAKKAKQGARITTKMIDSKRKSVDESLSFKQFLDQQ